VATLTWDSLRDLATFRSAKGCAISLYLDLDPSASPTQADVETRLRSLLAQAEKEPQHEYGHDQKLALESDLGRIRDWWTNEFDRDGARGYALFASSLDRLWRTMPLSLRVSDRVCIASELCLAPLVPLVGRDDNALVAFVGRERGQVFRLRGGRLVEEIDETEEQPGQHEQGGWSQGRYQRHIEKLVRDHLKTVGGEIDRRVRGDGGPDLVIVAPDELKPEIEGALSTETRGAIVGWAQAEAHASPAELLDVVKPHLDRAHAEREHAALERFQEELGRGGRAAAGWADTLAAASDGRVELLLVEERASREAFRCPECGRAAAEAGSCPVDGATLEPRADGLDLAAHHVLAMGGAIAIHGSGALTGHDGIGALLRF
jgi:peptide chain release factor subunit 1